MARSSLSQRVTLFSTLGLGAVWLMAILLMSVVLRSEQDELFDQQLAETAHVLLPLLSLAETSDAAGSGAPQPAFAIDEALIYRLFGLDGRVVRQVDLAGRASMPDLPPLSGAGFSATAGYRLYVTPFNAEGHALQLAAPLAERREAFREGMIGFLLPMLALLPLTWLLVGWTTRRALVPMRALRAEISARDGSRLDAIDAGDWPEDLVGIVGTLNGFMARLTQALEGERAFATNAAHELRTPVAVALAQVQQLRAEADTGQLARIEALERALQRMRRLVSRLLQLARADAGVGFSTGVHDIVALTRLVIADIVPRSAARRIVMVLPAMPVPARIDPDAYAIVLGNLVENALQHGGAEGEITVSARPGPVLEVVNDGPVVPDLDALSRRFSRRESGNGFGLGLHICGQIVEQAGGRLELISPAPGRDDGFMARVFLRDAGAA